jgi:hypothetical protein
VTQKEKLQGHEQKYVLKTALVRTSMAVVQGNYLLSTHKKKI